jgi:hypothetical protein
VPDGRAARRIPALVPSIASARRRLNVNSDPWLRDLPQLDLRPLAHSLSIHCLSVQNVIKNIFIMITKY